MDATLGTLAEAPQRVRADRTEEVEGLRAVAALAVLVTHVSLNSMGNSGPFGGFLARLDVGVAIFFVLSGYLLYRPFAAAQLRGDARPATGPYLRRRLLRIVPAYWLVVGVSFLLPTATGPTPQVPDDVASVPLSQLARFATFTQVYWRDSLAGPMPQAWTLAVELAFYLLLPVLAWGLARAGGATRADRLRRQWIVLGAMVVVALGYRGLMLALDPAFGPDAAENAFTPLKSWLPNHLDLFAIGMAFAVLRIELDDGGPGAPLAARCERALRRPAAPWALLAVAVATLWVLGYGLGMSRTALSHGRLGEPLLHLGYGIVAACLVLPAVFGRAAGGPVRGFLRSRPLQALGRVSYGIYLWQLVVIGRWVSSPFSPDGVPDPARHPGQQFNVAFWPTLAWTLALTLVLSTLTWWWVERPALRHRAGLGTFRAGLVGLAVAAAWVRLAALGAVAPRPPLEAPAFAHQQAGALADGAGFAAPLPWLYEHRAVPVADLPPVASLWPALSSATGARGILSHGALAIVAGVVLVVLAGLVGRRLAGTGAGLVAAAVVALHPGLVGLDASVAPDTLYAALVLGAVLALLRALSRPATDDPPTVGPPARRPGALSSDRTTLVLAGSLLALAALTVADGWPVVVLVALALLGIGAGAAARSRPSGGPATAMALVVPAALAVAAWTLRNALRLDEVVAVSTLRDTVTTATAGGWIRAGRLVDVALVVAAAAALVVVRDRRALLLAAPVATALIAAILAGGQPRAGAAATAALAVVVGLGVAAARDRTTVGVPAGRPGQ